MGDTRKKYPRFCLRNPKGHKQAKSEGCRHVPPDPYDDIMIGRHNYAPSRAAARMEKQGVPYEKCLEKLQKKFGLTREEAEEAAHRYNEESMKVVCFGDTHGHHRDLQIPDGDILIFAGDLMGWSKKTGPDDREIKQLVDFNEWIGNFPHKYKIFIPGNHDWIFENNYEHAKSLLTNMKCLNDSGMHTGRFKVWGSPVSPRFFDWAFNRDRGEDIKKHWDLIPYDVDILITHGPPRGILDIPPRKKDGPQGCDDLLERVNKLKNLRLHVFGHMHESYGMHEEKGTIFVNCSKGYHPIVNDAVVVEI
jgi:Icc-related predicted phosphoesterase